MVAYCITVLGQYADDCTYIPVVLHQYVLLVVVCHDQLLVGDVTGTELGTGPVLSGQYADDCTQLFVYIHQYVLAALLHPNALGFVAHVSCQVQLFVLPGLEGVGFGVGVG